LIIGYGGDIDENDSFLLASNPSLILIKKTQLTTRYFKSNKEMVEDNNLNVFMYQIMLKILIQYPKDYAMTPWNPMTSGFHL
jgi:hypothetical protein